MRKIIYIKKFKSADKGFNYDFTDTPIGFICLLDNDKVAKEVLNRDIPITKNLKIKFITN